MWTQKAMSVVWPAFLGACVMELLVFAVVDPMELQWSGQALPWSRQAIYTGSFFVFWAVSMVSCALTALLAEPAASFNECPFPSGERPDSCPRP